jgi:transglutaminase-like putative cysteine protease
MEPVIKRSAIARVLAAVFLAGVSCHAAAQGRLDAGPAPVTVLADLRARHAAVVAYEGFAGWLERYGLETWHETARNAAGLLTVVVQSRDLNHLFAAEVTPVEGDRRETVKRAAFIDAGNNTRRNAIDTARNELAKRKGPQRLHAVRPVVELSGKGAARLTWEIELEADDAVETLEYDFGSKALRSLRTRKLQSLLRPQKEAQPVAPEDLGENELHHPSQFADEARRWTQGLASTRERARKIYEKVEATYVYDGTIIAIWDYTWSDVLTRDLNDRKGICDEISVVQISYLRALGIPARLKLLRWKRNGIEESHAALEYNDSGTWRHMDAAWRTFNDPAGYARDPDVREVRVMDADEPRDSRSTRPTFYGRPDPTGDGKLHPFFDFVLTPGIAGEERPGYSK